MTELMRRRRALMMAQGDDWKSDYVQDGILMWLDGEHNSIDGSHDPSLTVWRDQSGNGYDWKLGGTFDIGAASVGVSGSCYGSLIAGKDLPPSPQFYEIVLSKSGAIDNAGEFIYGGYGNTQNYPSNIWLFHKNNADALNFNNTTPTKGVTPKLDGSITYYNSELYINDQKVANAGIYDGWSRTGKWLFQYSDRYNFSGRLFALRVYNRTLTESEILRNFAADQKRFGIEVSA